MSLFFGCVFFSPFISSVVGISGLYLLFCFYFILSRNSVISGVFEYFVESVVFSVFTQREDLYVLGMYCCVSYVNTGSAVHGAVVKLGFLFAMQNKQGSTV